MLKLMSPNDARKLDFWLQCYMCHTFYCPNQPLSDDNKKYFWNESKDTPFETYKNYGEPEKVLISVDEHSNLLGEKIEGYVRILSFYTAQKYRGLGLGSELMKELQNKYKKIYLDVLSLNKPAFAVYKHFGFEKVFTYRVPFTKDDGTVAYDEFYIMAYSEDGDLSDIKNKLKEIKELTTRPSTGAGLHLE